MPDVYYSIRRAISLGGVTICLAVLVFWLLPKSLKSTASFILTLLGTFMCCLWIDERLERRRKEKGKYIQDDYVANGYYASDNIDARMVVENNGERQVVLLEAKSSAHTQPKKNSLVEYLPQLWELFSFLLPRKTHRECFEPAYNDFLEKYARARQFRGKWPRRWIAFAFTILFLLMVADCLRVFLQSGTGRILLGLLPESARNWWRRQ